MDRFLGVRFEPMTINDDYGLGPVKLELESSQGEACIQVLPSGTAIMNVGRGRIILVSDLGERLVIEPGESGRVQLPPGAYRLACPDCGLHTGVHETWCPLWEPYEAAP
jgi:hypothetical protein